MKPEKLSFVALVTTRTSEQKQGLNLYGNFIQTPVIWEDVGLCTLKNRINISSEAKLFIRRRISNALSDVPSLEHNGYSDTFAISCRPPGAQRLDCLLTCWGHIGHMFQFLEKQLSTGTNHLSLSTITKAKIFNS